MTRKSSRVKVCLVLDVDNKAHLIKRYGGVAAGLEALVGVRDLDLSGLKIRPRDKRKRGVAGTLVRVTWSIDPARKALLEAAGGLTACVDALILRDRRALEELQLQRARHAAEMRRTRRPSPAR